jgi:hypothetical protein
MYIYNRTIAYVQTTVSSVAFKLTLSKVLAVVSTSVVSIRKAVSALRQAVSSVSSSVFYPVNRLLTLTATVYTSAVSFASKLIVLAKETVFVRASKVLMQKPLGFVRILVRPSKTVVTTIEQDTLNG